MARNSNQTILILHQLQTCLGRWWACSAAALVLLVASISQNVSQRRTLRRWRPSPREAAFQVKIKFFDSTLTFGQRNSCLFLQRKSSLCSARSFPRERSSKTHNQNPNSCQRDYQNKPFASKLWICCTHLTALFVCLSLHHRTTLSLSLKELSSATDINHKFPVKNTRVIACVFTRLPTQSCRISAGSRRTVVCQRLWFSCFKLSSPAAEV